MMVTGLLVREKGVWSTNLRLIRIDVEEISIDGNCSLDLFVGKAAMISGPTIHRIHWALLKRIIS